MTDHLNQSERPLSNDERQRLADALDHLNAAMDRLLSAGRVGWANEIARYRNAVEKELRA